MYKKLNFKLCIILLFFNFLQLSASNEIKNPLIDNSIQMSEAYVQAKLQAITDSNNKKSAYYKEVMSLSAARLNAILHKTYTSQKERDKECIDAIKTITTILNSVVTPGNKDDELIENKKNAIQEELNKRVGCIKVPPYFLHKDQLILDITELQSLVEQRFEAEINSQVYTTNPCIDWKTYRNNSNDTV